MMKKYYLQNLDCPRCAAKLEDAIRVINGVKFVSVNLASGSMYIDARDMAPVIEAIRRTEPAIRVVRSSGENDAASRNRFLRELLIIVLSTCLFAIGLLSLSALKQTPHQWGEYAVFLSAYILCGGSVLWRAVRNLGSRQLFDETFLMSIATLGAIAIQKMPEAVGVMLFYKIGEFLQDLSVRRSRASIKSLLEIRPDQAARKRGDELELVAPEEVQPGETIVIKAGERVPLDGIVTSGTSSVDTSALTGEPVPRSIGPGGEIMSGMINQTGMLEVLVSKPYQESSVAKILELVEHASSKKAETEKFITTFARYYTPVVVMGAVGVALLPPLLVDGATFTGWIYRALVLLVISCPCALMISIPLGYFGGVGGASRRGILVKGANVLDALCKIKTVVFDKTGTLTKGVFKVSDIVPAAGFSREDLLHIAATAEAQSNHPIALSIREAYGDRKLLDSIEQYEEIAGTGIRAKIGGKWIIAGNDRLLHLEQIAHDRCDVEGTVIHVAVEKRYAGYIVISDEIRSDAAGLSGRLKALGIRRVAMLTGDKHSVAARVASSLELDDFHADLLPADKVAALEDIMSEDDRGDRVAFVGDGINDAPVIARADVGIAMGGLGSDAAIETADVVIMTDVPSKTIEAIEVARLTRRIVWQNIVMALLVKALFIAAGIIGIASMWMAVFADVGVALLAVFNATRVLQDIR